MLFVIVLINNCHFHSRTRGNVLVIRLTYWEKPRKTQNINTNVPWRWTSFAYSSTFWLQRSPTMSNSTIISVYSSLGSGDAKFKLMKENLQCSSTFYCHSCFDWFLTVILIVMNILLSKAVMSSKYHQGKYPVRASYPITNVASERLTSE